MSKLHAIDANVLIRYLTRDDEDLWKKADAIIAAMDDGLVELLCNPVTLAEVVFVLGSKTFGLSREEVYRLLDPLVRSRGFRIPNKHLYMRALELYGTSVPHFGDACACALALTECEGRLISFDRKLSGIAGVERVEEL